MNLALTAAALALAADPAAGLKVPDGFTVTQFAGPELANDIYCLHVDARGRVVVAGRGYVRHLVDTDGDGKADKAVELIPAPADGPMGLLWEGDTLFVTSDGGVKKWIGVTGKELPKEKPTLVVKLKTGGEHDAHAVRRGPDGKLYVLCGNMAGVNAKTVSAKDSPVTEPVAGALLRMNDDGTDVAIIADGFRNPYDFDFDVTGTPYTYDSDNERCVGLPWYEPTRFYCVLSGGNYGWLSPQHAQTWRMPPYKPYVVPPVVTAGRGSPTGVACYRHTAFPKEYQGGFFFADWTFGTLWFTQPGDNQNATPFLSVSGENGFAPTGLAVDPTSGDLFVSIGGRGTRGAVYRIRHTKADKDQPIPFDSKPLPKWAKPAAVPLKAEALTNAKTDREKLAVVCGWFDALGGIGDPKVKGTVWEGYTFRKPPKQEDIAPLLKAVREEVPTRDADLNRELTRFLAAAGDTEDNAVSRVVTELIRQSDPIEHVHLLIALSRLTGVRTEDETARVADALVSLDGRYSKKAGTRDSNWPQRMGEVVKALAERDHRLTAAVLKEPGFGEPGHLWLAKLPIPKAAFGEAFEGTVRRAKSFAFQAGHAEYFGALEEKQARPLLKKMADAGFRDAAAVQLVQWPKEEDRPLFVAGVGSTSADVVTKCAAALAENGLKDDDLVPLVRALRRFPDAKKDAAVRTAVFAALKAHTRESFEDVAKWEAWLIEKHPELAKKLGGSGYDAAAWKKRLEKIDFAAGDAGKGKVVFAKAQCAACHNGTTAVGPSLVGVAKRFSRDDLLTAVLDPNRDVADRYRTVRFTTADQVYEGIVIYEATDGVILQTSADSTVRVPGKAIEGRKPGANSLMPAGLLDALKDDEVSDLMAYIRSL